MASPSNPLHYLLVAIQRYFALGRSRCRLGGLRVRPSMASGMNAQPLKRPVGTDNYLVKHGPIQITTVHGDAMPTRDGVTVQVTATLAWSHTLHDAGGPQHKPDHFDSDCNPDKQVDVSAPALTREALRMTVPGCALAALLCERQGAEEQVRQDVARHGEASGLIVHLVRIRTIDIPASVQAAGDARQLLAMRTCAERLRRRPERRCPAGSSNLAGSR